MDQEEASVRPRDLTRPRPSASLALTPAPAAVFPGSFAADKRQQEQHVPVKVGAATSIWLYFTDGWQSPAIWKSA
ncbi:hypothetical protein MMC30_001626, partial [Trapelia coarctata]|nr:hypothetical protein [Trapelia coarctata]